MTTGEKALIGVAVVFVGTLALAGIGFELVKLWCVYEIVKHVLELL